jgi:hypothetical protein
MHKGCIYGCIVYKLDEGANYDCTSSIVSGIQTMCELILCPKYKIEGFHKSGCIKGNCNKCGISKLQFCFREVDPNNEMLIPWKRFENVYVGHSNDGGD